MSACLLVISRFGMNGLSELSACNREFVSVCRSYEKGNTHPAPIKSLKLTGIVGNAPLIERDVLLVRHVGVSVCDAMAGW